MPVLLVAWERREQLWVGSVVAMPNKDVELFELPAGRLRVAGCRCRAG